MTDINDLKFTIEPDESYYNNGPEQERYYFEKVKE